MLCPKCKQNTLKHLHNVAHGITGTHMKDSERFECKCGFVCSNNKFAKSYGLKFVFDIDID